MFQRSALKIVFQITKKRIENEIWSLVNVKDLTVIDFGIGESTERLVDLGAKVIAVDKDFEKLKKYKNLGISLVNCDVTNLPFNRRIADLAIFYFALHEINPLLHKQVVSTAHKISSRIMVVEPSPDGCSAYRRYSEIWRNAMHSIGKFEDYQTLSYWKKLIESCNFKILVLKRVKQNTEIPFEELEKIFQTTIEKWKKLRVEDEYINKLHDLLKNIRENGMRWSDLTVIIGESNVAT
ncbi:MAG: methyltransferase domain-containing protein [Fervidobacterium sp.]